MSTPVTGTRALDRPSVWALAVLGVSLPFVAVLCAILWRTPFPLTEVVAILEDVAERGPGGFLVPDAAYYRPLYYLMTAAIWGGLGSLDALLTSFRLLHIAAVVTLVLLLVWHLRPRGLLEAAAAAAAVAVLGGSPGFQDNLELSLIHTIVCMALALAVFVLVEQSPRRWHTPAIVALLLVAVGFKEQGLLITPVVVAAWWAGAPGASRRSAIAVTGVAVVYVAVRLLWSGTWPMFGQAIGVGFSEFEPDEAAARFGAFPYVIYAYNSLATMLNVLFSEPTRGTFRIVDAIVHLRLDWWPFVQAGSAAALTGLIGWWGVGRLREAAREGWSREARAFFLFLVALLAAGALSFSYSRDRLGGMALVFYAVAAYYALRAAGLRAAAAGGPRALAAGLALMVLVAAWQSRTITTLEYARYSADVNQRQWLTMLPERRQEFAGRQTYLDIMDAMIEQGIEPDSPRQTRYPPSIKRVLGLP